MTQPTNGHSIPDRRITVVMILSGIVVVLIGLGTPAVISTSNTTSEVRKSTELAGCRSAYAAEVTDRRTEFDIARSHRDTAAAVVNLTLLELAQAAIFGDDTRVQELEAQLPALREAVRDANEAVADADAALIAANQVYQDAIALSRSDPEQFLADCSNTQ